MTFPATVPVVQIYAGDTYRQSYEFKDNATGNPVDLDTEGWHTWKAQYRVTRDSVEHVDFQVDHSEADLGIITVSMTAAVTKPLERNGVWDLQAKNGATVRTFITSDVHVLREVTRD